MALAPSAAAFDAALKDPDIRRKITARFDRATIIRYRRGQRVPDIETALLIKEICPHILVDGWVMSRRRKAA